MENTSNNNKNNSSSTLSDLEKINNLISTQTAIEEVLSSFRKKQIYLVSKWFLAGTLAFLFFILQDPKKIIEIYGALQTKISAAFFFLSLYFGIQNSIDAEIISSLVNSEKLQVLSRAGQRLNQDNVESKIEDKSKYIQDEKRFFQENLKKPIENFLEGTSKWWLQIVTFSIGIFILFFTFLFTL